MKRIVGISVLILSLFLLHPMGSAQETTAGQHVRSLFLEAVDSTCVSYMDFDYVKAEAWLDMARGIVYDTTSFLMTKCLDVRSYINLPQNRIDQWCDTLRMMHSYFGRRQDTLSIYGQGVTDWIQGLYELKNYSPSALEFYQRSEHHFKQIGRVELENYSVLMQSETLIASHRMVESNAVARRMLATSDSTRNARLRFQAQQQLLFVYAMVNMTDLAEALCQSVEAEGFYEKSPLDEARYLQNKAYCLLSNRDYESAYALKERILFLNELIDNPIEGWRTYLLLSKLCSVTHRYGELEHYLEKCREYLPQISSPPYFTVHSFDHLPILTAELLVSKGDIWGAKRVIERMEVPDRFMGSVDHIEPYYGLREYIATRTGDYEEAIHILRRRNELNDSILQRNVDIRTRDLELLLASDSTIQNQRTRLYTSQMTIENTRIGITLLVVVGFLLAALAVLSYLLYIRVKHRKSARQKALQHLRLEHEVREQTLELKRRNDLLNEENLDTLRSQAYAKHVQQSILPQQAAINNYLGSQGSFVVFQPKGLISGDFYWFRRMKSGRIVVVCADSWGDDVQGAILSTLGITLLNDHVREDHRYTAAGILNLFNDRLLSIFPSIKPLEGINCSVAIIDTERCLINLSLARQKVLLSHHGLMTSISGVNRKIGEVEKPFVNREFEDQNIQYRQGDVLYLFTDGVTSCFGGTNGEKLKLSGLKKILQEAEKLPASKRQLAVKRMLGKWAGEYPKSDDITIISLAL